MSIRLVARRSLLLLATSFLLWLAWQAIAGAFRQLAHACTAGQKIETVAQVECGLLSVLMVLTCFRWRQWSLKIQVLWEISLATVAGLSSMVWGPPMPMISIFFVAIMLLVAQATRWVLRTALDSDFRIINGADANARRWVADLIMRTNHREQEVK